MVITSNVSANMILGHLNINVKNKSKATQQLALAEKICNAGDDASTYAISEKMRVSIRALNQADANVQNGASMLKVAEGAIQSQINLLRTVKERVINAHNDTNTDADRLIIQKEITNYYNEINDIAAETTFNGKHLLLGTKVQESVKSWYKLDHAETLEDSDSLGIISGSIATLDGQTGPFNIFGASTDEVPNDGYNVKTISATAVPGYDTAATTTATKSNLHGGTPNDPNKLVIDLGDDTIRDTLYDTSFKVIYPDGEETFVISNYSGQQYRGISSSNIIDGHLQSVSQIAAIIANRLQNIMHVSYSSSTTGARVIELTTVDTGTKTNDISKYNAYGVALAGGDGYTATRALPSTMFTNKQVGKNGLTAHWDWNLSSYNTTSSSTTESFISQLVGKGFSHSGLGTTYEFVDSGKSPTIDSVSKLDGANVIDLNAVRNAVSGGQTLAEAFANLVASRMGSVAEVVKNSSNQVTGIKINATVPGDEGNNQYISFKQGDLRDYTIDFSSVFSSQGAGGLDGKGFRFYDASNPNKWVNVLFVDGVNPNDDDRPASGTGDLDISTFVVDVSDVTSLKSLISTIYKGDGDKNPEGLNDFLSRTGQNFQIAADYDNGTITIYDTRRYHVLDTDPHAAQGAKIADGIMDNVVEDYRYVYANDLVIQHTDKSSANIHVIIPQTTMDHIFGYKIGAGSLDDYSVLTSEKREMLLGWDTPTKVRGALDKGLQYLIDANTLIGAQINHMENADANLVTVIENTTAAESVMRDADMSRSAMDWAKYNILSQATTAMLSQFNHNSSDVLGLLQ
ncbi:flagellin [Anaerovibrio sp. RM50]|uniref:flagellin n=1 Tax=Anaerovibrio sp. RM50 TaxID=1200557 RepID=UPI000685ABB3|nr:flagellin [Anaerovibrio sp. RM50]